MNVLIVCESSGIVRDAFRARGHDAWSCDLLPCEADPAWHITGDAMEAIRSRCWDLLIAHPPCTYLCASGMHWTTRGLRDPALTEDALAFVRALMGCGIPRIAIENPVGAIGSRIRPASQYVQPYQFGHDASKRTGLWLTGLALLTPTQYVPPRIVDGKPRWANQTDSGQNRLAPSADRWRDRSRTYAGIAAAMAEQWGKE
jgi:hypothetical protein